MGMFNIMDNSAGFMSQLQDMNAMQMAKPILKFGKAQATIASEVIDEALAIGPDESIRALAVEIKKYELHGLSVEAATSALIQRAVMQALSGLAEEDPASR